MITVQEVLDNLEITFEEKCVIQKFENKIDAALYNSGGAPVRFDIKEQVSPKIAAAIQRKYEEGHWRVNVTAEAFTFFPMTLMSPPGSKPAAAKAQALPSMLTVPKTTQAAVPAGKRLLVRMPTRGRPAQAIRVLTEYRRMAGAPILLEVVVDEDDESMLACEVLQRLVALDCVVTVGKHKSKIEAVNGGRLTEWDVLLLASDDMMPVASGYAARVLEKMEEHWPHLDGAIYFSDGYQGVKLCSLPIFGKRLWEQYGHRIYEPEYTSLWSDAEQTEVLKAAGRLIYVDEVIIEHRHHVITGAADDLYRKNDAFWERDKAVYERRKEMKRERAQIGFDSPPLVLSLCICTVPARRAQLERLLEHLWAQILRLPGDLAHPYKPEVSAGYARTVEILVDAREGITIGEKRQNLYERARGHFVISVDDDDWVSHDYVARILTALCKNPDADCASLVGVMTTSGEDPKKFEHSIKYTEWANKEIYERTPNHLNAVRRELALQVGFPSKNHAEDHSFSTRLRPLLKSEASIGSTPAYLYWFIPHEDRK